MKQKKTKAETETQLNLDQIESKTEEETEPQAGEQYSQQTCEKQAKKLTIILKDHVNTRSDIIESTIEMTKNLQRSIDIIKRIRRTFINHLTETYNEDIKKETITITRLALCDKLYWKNVKKTIDQKLEHQ